MCPGRFVRAEEHDFLTTGSAAEDGAHPGRVAERVAEIRAVAYRSIFSLGREREATVAVTDGGRMSRGRIVDASATPSGKCSAVTDVGVPAEVTRRALSGGPRHQAQRKFPENAL